jgi:hypothetical protein
MAYNPGIPVTEGNPLPVAAIISPGGNPATIVTGQIALTAGSRAALPSAALVNGIIVKSSPSNAANVLIGGVGVTTTADGTGNGYILAPGEAASFGVSNASAIYAISTAAAVLSYEGN